VNLDTVSMQKRCTLSQWQSVSLRFTGVRLLSVQGFDAAVDSHASFQLLDHREEQPARLFIFLVVKLQMLNGCREAGYYRLQPLNLVVLFLQSLVEHLDLVADIGEH